MTREQFLGIPKIVSQAAVLLRQPARLRPLAPSAAVFLGRYSAKITNNAAAMFYGPDIVGSYDRTNSNRSLLVVHPEHRGNGLATEMIYQVARLNPGTPLPSTVRTAALQRACIKAADRLQAEGFFA